VDPSAPPASLLPLLIHFTLLAFPAPPLRTLIARYLLSCTSISPLPAPDTITTPARPACLIAGGKDARLPSGCCLFAQTPACVPLIHTSSPLCLAIFFYITYIDALIQARYKELAIYNPKTTSCNAIFFARSYVLACFRGPGHNISQADALEASSCHSMHRFLRHEMYLVREKPHPYWRFIIIYQDLKAKCERRTPIMITHMKRASATPPSPPPSRV
jgi:hypothetical protein